mgnify:FL=1
MYNLESLTSLEESRLLQLGSKNRRREETKREQQVSERGGREA